MNKNNDAVASCIGLLTTFAVTLVIASILNGWALSILWAWFIVPVFGLPALSIVQAIGLAMVVSFLTRRIAIKKEDDEEEGAWLIIAKALLYAIISPLLTVFVGYIVTLFL